MDQIGNSSLFINIHYCLYLEKCMYAFLNMSWRACKLAPKTAVMDFTW